MITLNVLGTPAPKGSSRPMLNRKTGKPFTFRGGSKSAEVKLDTWDGAVRSSAAAAVGAVEAPPFCRGAAHRRDGVPPRAARRALGQGKERL